MPGPKKLMKKVGSVGKKLSNAVPGVGVTKAKRNINKVRRQMKKY